MVSSDLQRAHETAAACATALGLPVSLQPGLRGQGFGVLEGLRAEEVRDAHPDLWTPWCRHRADDAHLQGLPEQPSTVPAGVASRSAAG